MFSVTDDAERVFGAVKRPAPEMVPTVASPPRTLLTDHETLGCGLPWMVTLYCWVPPALTVALLGETDIAGCVFAAEDAAETEEPTPHPQSRTLIASAVRVCFR